LRTGEPGIAARIIPRMPPIEVPTQSTVSAPSWPSSVVRSVQ
jgi:hypothetical protein